MQFLNLMITVFTPLVLNKTHCTESFGAVDTVELKGTLTVGTTKTILVITSLEVVY